MKEEFAQLSKEQAQQVCRNMGNLAARLNITQEAIAERAGFERSSVNRLFSGRYAPRLDIVFSVLAAINELSGKQHTLKDVDVTRADAEATTPE